jgi:hypothetical protein
MFKNCLLVDHDVACLRTDKCFNHNSNICRAHHESIWRSKQTSCEHILDKSKLNKIECPPEAGLGNDFAWSLLGTLAGTLVWPRVCGPMWQIIGLVGPRK